MKFRIVERRGVFRIRKCERVVSFDKPFRLKNWAHNDDIHLKWGAWRWLEELKHVHGEGWPMEYVSIEFDSYKKAEKHIKKFYGSKGVDAIEKPEWRTV
jgi:hypothetical protein